MTTIRGERACWIRGGINVCWHEYNCDGKDALSRWQGEWKIREDIKQRSAAHHMYSWAEIIKPVERLCCRSLPCVLLPMGSRHRLCTAV